MELRAELERVRHEHALAVAEAEHGRLLAQAEAQHLREQLAARNEHIADLQRALKALMPAPERPVLTQVSVPGQAQPEGGSAGAWRDNMRRAVSGSGGGSVGSRMRKVCVLNVVHHLLQVDAPVAARVRPLGEGEARHRAEAAEERKGHVRPFRNVFFCKMNEPNVFIGYGDQAAGRRQDR